ncbi:hypothetical protein [Mesobacillus harenae]|uniref:hypothetical protein n=1 Tax=Mesobacillus harenae TaxID=2213203 RepID=UPI0015805B3C|nr:hypothetical protein [Mesobacillus harenae]
MENSEVIKYKFEAADENEELIIKGEIYGRAALPALDDLKLNAVIALLNSVDQQNFQAAGKSDVFTELIKEIEETVDAIKKHDRFQGEIK